MLRSIFSLIQRIIDSDKKYNNTKSAAVIYCFTNPDNTVNMDLEIDGKRRKVMKNLEHKENASVAHKQKQFSIKTERGDSVTCSHDVNVNIVPKGQKKVEKESVSNRVVFLNKSKEERSDAKDVDEEVQPNVKDLLQHFPTKRMDLSSTEKDQISSLLEQIQKMKTGLQRLQEIALQFNTSERFTEDVNYLINNVKPYLQRHANKEAKERNISPKS